MRKAFIDELIQIAEHNPRIVLVVGDLGYGVVEPFAERFPDRFFNAGVAEQGMVGISAGLASEGYHVFAYSIANFSTFRCAEQIRNDVDYHELPVTMVAVGGGLAYGSLGYSHHAIQDYALMRVLPNTLIAAPGDAFETRACLRYLTSNPGPSYLRLGKSEDRLVHDAVPELVPGEWLTLRKPGEEGSADAIVTTGAALAIAEAWLDAGDYPGFGLYSMPLWGMAQKPVQAVQVERHRRVVTVEDHIADAGFGSWLHEALQGTDLGSRLEVRALNTRVFGAVGAQDTLNSLGGL